MSTLYFGRKEPAEKPLEALQRKGRRYGVHVHRAKAFDEYRDRFEAIAGHVLVFDGRGEKLAGPLSVEDADRWLYDFVLGHRDRSGQ